MISGWVNRILSCVLRSFSLALIFFLMTAEACGAGIDETAGKAARIDALVSLYEKYGYINGAVLLAEHGKIVYEKGIGYANIESRTPNTPRTKFGIASITKQFTAVLVLQQVAEGRIRLETKITEYLPWYRKDTGERMTVEQLIHHTSGLPPDFDSPEFSDSEAAGRHYEPQEFAQKFCQQNLQSEPGTKWEYSNCGYDLLGLILEGVTGKSFGELLQERLLSPLGMKDTGVDHNDLPQRGGASGYVRHAGPRYTAGPYIDRAHIFAAGAMYSTVEDLFLWSRALSDSGWLPKDIRDPIFRAGINDWGYGWFITKIPPGEPGAGGTLEEMRGDMPGNFFSWILRYPQRDGVIIVLRNAYGSTEGLEQNLQAILFNQEPRMPARNLKDVLARAWQLPEEWAVSHRAFSMLIFLLLLTLIWHMARRGKDLREIVGSLSHSDADRSRRKS